MRRWWLGAFGAVLVLAALPAAASAQARRCRQTLPADAQRIVNFQGQEVLYFKDPTHWVCTGGILLEADSAVLNGATSTIQLVGNVVYRDTARELTSAWANYLGKQDQLFARGDVVLRDLVNGSVISGDQLDYRRETPERPRSLMIVQGGRPHAILPARFDSAGATPDTAAPIEVWGQRIQLDGQDVFRAEGNVELLRGEMRGAGQTVRYDRAGERLSLAGHAHVENDTYRLEGERIDARLHGDTLQEVHADTAARLISDQLTMSSERLRIGFAGGEIERLEAWTSTPSPAGVAAPSEGTGPGPANSSSQRPLAIARDFRLRADSIDARADSGAIREVRAIGRAHGERTPDSPGPTVPSIVARDWIQGDTIIGYFARERGNRAPDSSPAPGSAAGDSVRTVLQRVVVIGGTSPALSLYRREPGQPNCPPAVNFMQAQRIVLYLAEGDVTRVEAEGPIQGRYLESATQCGAPPDSIPAPTTEGGERKGS